MFLGMEGRERRALKKKKKIFKKEKRKLKRTEKKNRKKKRAGGCWAENCLNDKNRGIKNYFKKVLGKKVSEKVFFLELSFF